MRFQVVLSRASLRDLQSRFVNDIYRTALAGASGSSAFANDGSIIKDVKPW
jgi:hypothetical protein